MKVKMRRAIQSAVAGALFLISATGLTIILRVGFDSSIMLFVILILTLGIYLFNEAAK